MGDLLSVCNGSGLKNFGLLRRDCACQRMTLPKDIGRYLWHQKTAFVTPDVQYKFTRMLFGMVNSGGTQVRGLRKILEPGVGSYIDDIVIYSDSWEGSS